MIQVQKRDLEILKAVFTFRVLTYGQIQKLFFTRNRDSAARRRIRSLCRAKLLKASFANVFGRAVKWVSLTERGWDTIKDSWKIEMDRPHLKSESPEHDFRMAELHSHLRQLSIYKNFFSENLLQSASFFESDASYGDLVELESDGVLSLKGAQGEEYVYAVELELSRKSPDRYLEKVNAYYRARGIDGVIYVCADQEIFDLLTRIDRQVRLTQPSILFLALESEILLSKASMIFENSAQEKLRLF